MNWLWKLLGYHVCEHFTMWETKEADYIRTPVTHEEGINCILNRSPGVRFSQKWQERTCTTCGKLYQRTLQI